MKFCSSPILLSAACYSVVALMSLSSCQSNSEETNATNLSKDEATPSAYAMEFTPEQQKEREAKWAEEGARRIELSNGYSVFTQTFGENPDVCILSLARRSGSDP